MLISLIVVITAQYAMLYETIRLYVLNIYSFCQLYLKAEKKILKKKLLLVINQIFPCP